MFPLPLPSPLAFIFHGSIWIWFWICSLPNANDLHNQLNSNSRINAYNCESVVTLIHFPSCPLFDFSLSGARLFIPISFALSTVMPPISQNLIHVTQKCRVAKSHQKKKVQRNSFPENHYYDSFEMTWQILWIIMCPIRFAIAVNLKQVKLRFCFVGPFVYFPNVAHFTNFSSGTISICNWSQWYQSLVVLLSQMILNEKFFCK